MNAIIYRAYNIITGKSYIGQTTRKLKERIKWHYSSSKKSKVHFAYALQKYKKDDWIWSIEKTCDVDQLDQLEIELILFYDSYNNGYNLTKGGKPLLLTDNPLYKPETIRFYSTQTGTISCTRKEFREKFDFRHAQVCDLIRERTKSCGNFVLDKNKDKYNDILNIITLYHPLYGEVTTSSTDFCRKYGLSKAQMFSFRKKQIQATLSGWKRLV
jgi:hypothetical protein